VATTDPIFKRLRFNQTISEDILYLGDVALFVFGPEIIGQKVCDVLARVARVSLDDENNLEDFEGRIACSGVFYHACWRDVGVLRQRHDGGVGVVVGSMSVRVCWLLFDK